MLVRFLWRQEPGFLPDVLSSQTTLLRRMKNDTPAQPNLGVAAFCHAAKRLGIKEERIEFRTDCYERIEKNIEVQRETGNKSLLRLPTREADPAKKDVEPVMHQTRQISTLTPLKGVLN